VVSGQLHVPAALPPGIEPPLDRRLGGSQSWSERGEEKNSQPLPRLEPPIIQFVAQRYTTELSRFSGIVFYSTVSQIRPVTRFNHDSWSYCEGLWEWLIHFTKLILEIVHNLRYTWYKRRFGNCLYSRLHAIVSIILTYWNIFSVEISASCWSRNRDLLNIIKAHSAGVMVK
jgi:hypothetical protein